MDFSEKDAARSKWKSTQRHKRGRGGRGGSAGRSSRPKAREELGSNEDRYLEPEVGEHAGPVRKSQGADLAQLLEGAEAYDSGYYHRSRVNLLQEYGLPPADALSYQGLTFNLKGLAACLSCLPRNELFMTDAFDEEGRPGTPHEPSEVANPAAGRSGKPSNPNGVEHRADQPSQPAATQQDVQARHAHGSSSAGSALPPDDPQRVQRQAQQAQRALPAGASEASGQPREASGIAPTAVSALAMVAHPAAERLTGVAGPPSVDVLPAVPASQAQPSGQRAGEAPQHMQHAVAVAGAAHDDELDFLLGLEAAPTQARQQQQQVRQPQPLLNKQQQVPSSVPSLERLLQPVSQMAPGPPVSASSSPAGAMPHMPQARKEQSLDDWLDSL